MIQRNPQYLKLPELELTLLGHNEPTTAQPNAVWCTKGAWEVFTLVASSSPASRPSNKETSALESNSVKRDAKLLVLG